MFAIVGQANAMLAGRILKVTHQGRYQERSLISRITFFYFWFPCVVETAHQSPFKYTLKILDRIVSYRS